MTERIKELVSLLNKANKAYYQDAIEIMSNYEYDKLYDELVQLEKETGIVFSNSPTVNVGYEVVSELPKEKHESPMLSLDKTKDKNVLLEWLGNREGVLSWKLDGLTVVLTYENGELVKAVTRGNGYIGENVTNNAKQIKNLPLQIPYKEKLILRGEAVITYSDFEKINAELPEDVEKYKNARNLASGSIRQLDSKKAAQRNLRWIAFRVENPPESMDKVTEQFNWLSSMGFEVVPHTVVTKQNLIKVIQCYAESIRDYEVPSDGLVVTYTSYSYGLSLGSSAKFPKHSFAFKWQDEVERTTLLEVIWHVSRSGIVNPIALFDKVLIEGTCIQRATLGNSGFITKLQLGIGDVISVYKANKIIPQILENHTRSGTVKIPEKCPACGSATRLVKDILYCTNPMCKAKLVARLVHFCSRDAMDIRGLSDKNLEMLVRKGWVKDFCDLYKLQEKKMIWQNTPGYSITSVTSKLQAIEASKKTNLVRFLYALNILGIGIVQSKELAEKFKTWNEFAKALESQYDFTRLDGFGDVLNQNIYDWYKVEFEMAQRLAEIMEFEDSQKEKSDKLKGLTFVITGSLTKFKNRTELQAIIEQNGGKCSSSCSKKTDYLINNDIMSNSGKNKQAKELGIPIILEEDFQKML